MRFIPFVLIGCFLSLAVVVRGQEAGIEGEVRSRIEYRNGFRKPLADTLSGATVATLRTRINLNYATEKIKTLIILQDSRTYGQTGINDTKNSLGIFEAWGSYLFTPEFSATLGRQAIEYDDKRLFSASKNWGNTGKAHDMLLLKYESTTGLKLHLGSAWNNSGEHEYEKIYTVAQSYKALTYLWFAKPLGKLDFSAIWINDVSSYGTTDAGSSSRRTFRNTLGGNLGLKKAELPFAFYATAYYQFGHDPDRRRLSACLLALNTQYRFAEAWSLTAGADYFSGTSPGRKQEGINNTFNKLYGSNHSFNGSMEYWSTLPEGGLTDLYGTLLFRPDSKFNLSLSFHSFALAGKLPESASANIGAETDLTVNYILSPHFSIQGGWSAYFRNRQTDVLKEQTGIPTHFPHWCYVMLTFRPRFL
ncbi:MAG: alginate export family protein [Tannerellaceae bacterium]|nr:alginate export family protein [Tannerellaceae bacterium]